MNSTQPQITVNRLPAKQQNAINWLRLALLAVAVAAPAGVLAQESWAWRNPLPQGNDLAAVVQGGARYVAVGKMGAIVISDDGTTWTRQSSGVTNDLTGVTSDGVRFVAVGKSGTILTCSDGLNWTPAFSPTSEDLLGVAYSADSTLFVAVGTNGVVLTSWDADIWDAQNSGTTSALRAVASDGQYTFMAVGDNGAVAYSVNGTGDDWTFVRTNTAWNLNGITYGCTTFIAVGLNSGPTAGQRQGLIVTLEHDSYGVVRNSQTDNQLNGVTYSPVLGLLAVGNGGTILNSTDCGFTWSVKNSGTTENLDGACRSTTGLMAVGRKGLILSSANATTWLKRTVGLLDDLRAAIFSGSDFVVAGMAGHILTPSGLVWTDRITGVTNDLSGLASGAGKLVAVGTAGRILTSANGTTWTIQPIPLAIDLAAVTYGGNTFVAVGWTNVLTSTNGVNWSSQASGTTYTLNGVTYGGGLFVAVGAAGRILTSPNGTNWTTQFSGGAPLNTVAYGGGVYVAVGKQGRMLTSTNGTNWTAQTSGTTRELRGVTYGGVPAAGAMRFVAVGANGTVLTSTNGANWTAQSSGVPGTLDSVAYGNNQFLAAGAGGVILSSWVAGVVPRITSATAVTNRACVYFTYQIVADNNPLGYDALGLPPGLAVAGGTGLISGVPQTNGLFQITLLASNQSGLGTASLALTLLQSNQTINLPTIPAHYLCDSPFAVNATASSGLPVTLECLSGPATLNGNVVTLTGVAGTVCLRASQSGNACYTPATSVTNCFTVAIRPQSISFAAIASQYQCNPPVTWSASADSGLPVTLEVVSGPGFITNGTQVAWTSTGTVCLRASQPGNACYSPATPVTRCFDVSLQPQTVAFGVIANRSLCDPPVTLTASVPSGLPVTFAVLSGPALLTNGNQVLATNAGSVTVRASQAGNQCYAPASLDRSFSVAQWSQTIAFTAITNRYQCDPPVTLGATASSGLPITFTVLFGPAYLTNGNQVIWTNTGAICVQAAQVGNYCYAPAASITNCFSISLKPQAITFAALTDRYLCDPPLTLGATANSGLPVSFSVVSGPASLVGNQLSWSNPGSVTIRASQAGNECFAGAVNVERIFNVTIPTQTITFPQPGTALQHQPFLLPGTSSSGLPVTYAVASGPALVVGNLCLATNQGTVTLRAAQAGNSCFLPAADVSRSFAANAYGPISSLPGDTVTSIACGAGAFVAASGTKIYASPDGLAWVLVAGSADRFSDVVFGGDKFVAASNAQIRYSSNGLDWAATVGVWGQVLDPGLIYGNGKFVALGRFYNYSDYVGWSMASTDGINWASGSTIANREFLNRAAYGKGMFLAFSAKYSSTWTYHLSYSINGLDWSSGGLPAPSALLDLCFAYDRFISVGSSNSLGTLGMITTSANGTNWVTALSSGQGLNRINYAGWRLVAGGNAGRILASTDGTNWIEQTGGSSSYTFYRSAYGNGKSIIVGNNGYDSVFLVSYPAVPIPTLAGGTALDGMVGSSFSYQVIAGNNPALYTAVGLPAGLSINATNGLISGIPTVPGTFAVTLGAASGGGIGTKTLNLSITDGTCPVFSSLPASQTSLVGQTTTFHSLAVSLAPLFYQWQKNGTNLVNNGRITGAGSNALTIANVQYSDAGSYTVVVTNACGSTSSPPAILTVPWGFVPGSLVVSNGRYCTLLQGEPGRVVVVLTSTNVALPMIYWTALGTVTNTGNPVPFCDPVALTNSPRRFYRTMQAP